MRVRLTLTDFANITSVSGSKKVTRIRRIKNRGYYNPAFDFYKPLRDGIIALHQLQCPRETLALLPNWARNDTQACHFPGVIQGYRRWWGRKKLIWFHPPRLKIQARNLSLIVNPELGLILNGVPHVLKLHFLSKPLSSEQVEMMNHLLEKAALDQCPQDTVVGILDLRKGKLITRVGGDDAQAAVAGEVANIATILEAA